MDDPAAKPRNKYDQWVFEAFGVDPRDYELGGPKDPARKAGATPAPAAGTTNAAEDPHNIASMEKTTFTAGQGKAPMVADGGGGLELAVYTPGQGAGVGGSPASPVNPADKALSTADKAIDVLDKLVKTVKGVIGATADSTGVELKGQGTASVAPDGSWESLQGGKDGSQTFSLKIRNIFDMDLGDLAIALLWRGSLSCNGRGHFLKDIRIHVSGNVSLWQKVNIVAEFGDPTNDGSKDDPIASLPVDIVCSLTSATIFRGQKVFSGTLSGATGFKELPTA